MPCRTPDRSTDRLTDRPALSKSSRRRVTKHWVRRALALVALGLVLWIGFAFASAVQPASRRLGNAAYVLLVLAIATSALGFLLVLDLTCALVPASRLLESLGRHQLATFLVANLLTGAVNLTFPLLSGTGDLPTTGTRPGLARLLLAAYTALFAAVPLSMDAVTEHDRRVVATAKRALYRSE